VAWDAERDVSCTSHAERCISGAVRGARVCPSAFAYRKTHRLKLLAPVRSRPTCSADPLLLAIPWQGERSGGRPGPYAVRRRPVSDTHSHAAAKEAQVRHYSWDHSAERAVP
jgi:hypothetical protein